MKSVVPSTRCASVFLCPCSVWTLITGSEFINRGLYDHCQRWNITLTRSRSYKKNDSCYVEQKNWSVIRRVISYHRLGSKRAFLSLDSIYIMFVSKLTSSNQYLSS